MRIRNKRTILKSCNHFTCSLTLISSRKNSGNYTCEAQNELGIVNETASVKVLCKYISNDRILYQQYKIIGKRKSGTEPHAVIMGL